MRAVTQMINGGYFDALDGVVLQEGDQLRVRWPDGTLTEETCKIHRASTCAREHGRVIDLPFESAYVEKVYCGLTVAIWLRQPTQTVFCEKIGAMHR